MTRSRTFLAAFATLAAVAAVLSRSDVGSRHVVAPSAVEQWVAEQADKLPVLNLIRQRLMPRASSATAALAGGVNLPHEVRVPAMRDGHNYGWLQLPRGTWVELLAVEGDHAYIRYDESVVRLPRRAMAQGTVTLAKRLPLDSRG